MVCGGVSVFRVGKRCVGEDVKFSHTKKQNKDFRDCRVHYQEHMDEEQTKTTNVTRQSHCKEKTRS